MSDRRLTERSVRAEMFLSLVRRSLRALPFSLLIPFGAVAQQAGPIPVGVVRIEKTPVTQAAEFVGRVNAVGRVEVRARVKGYLEAVLFKEGDEIKAGAPLYRIEKGQFEGDVKQAEGAYLRSKASKELSSIQLKRAEDLLTKQSGTAVARDQAQAADDQSKGQMVSDEGALSIAKINLSYTEITAPIAGKVGATKVTVGNVVGPDSGILTTIVSQDPMYVTFPVSDRDFLKMRTSERAAARDQIKVGIKFADGSLYDQTGVINFVDVSVDRTTDTISVRASIPNPKGGLVDGQFVRAVLEGDKPEEKLVVPQAALMADQKGVYVFVVEDDKAAVKRLTTGGDFKDGVIVESGLSQGDLVIVDGLQSVRPGVAVRATPAAESLGMK